MTTDLFGNPTRQEPRKARFSSRGAVCRANIAIRMIQSGAGLGTRAFDNCFENFDGEEISGAIMAKIEADAYFARQVVKAKWYMSPEWITTATARIEREAH